MTFSTILTASGHFRNDSDFQFIPRFLIRFVIVLLRFLLFQEQNDRQHRRQGLTRRECRPDTVHPEDGTQHQRTGNNGDHAAAQ